MKQGFQVALIVAFGIWVLYQIKHSHDKKKDYGGPSGNLLTLKHTTIVLGRNAYAGSTDVDQAMHSAIPEKDFIRSEEKIGIVRVKNLHEVKEVKENADDFVVLQSNGTESTLISAQGDPEHVIYSFPDENGIPQDYKEKSDDHQGKPMLHSKSNEQSIDIVLDSGTVESVTEIANTIRAKLHATFDDETSLHSAHILDKSGAKGTFGTAKPYDLVTGNPKSVSVQHDRKGITDPMILSQIKINAQDEQ